MPRQASSRKSVSAKKVKPSATAAKKPSTKNNKTSTVSNTQGRKSQTISQETKDHDDEDAGTLLSGWESSESRDSVPKRGEKEEKEENIIEIFSDAEDKRPPSTPSPVKKKPSKVTTPTADPPSTPRGRKPLITPPATPRSTKKVVVEIPVTPRGLKRKHNNTPSSKKQSNVSVSKFGLDANKTEATPPSKEEHECLPEKPDSEGEDSDSSQESQHEMRLKRLRKAAVPAKKIAHKRIIKKPTSKKNLKGKGRARDLSSAEESDDKMDSAESGSDNTNDTTHVKDDKDIDDKQEESDDGALSDPYAWNEAVIHGILDVAKQSPEIQDVYHKMGMGKLPSRICYMVPGDADSKIKPFIQFADYSILRNRLPNDVAKGQLRSNIDFSKYGIFHALGHGPTSDLHWISKVLHCQPPARSGLVPAVFLMVGECASSALNATLNENSPYANSFTRKIYIRPLEQEYCLAEAALGELMDREAFHGPISENATLLFSTKKRTWTSGVPAVESTTSAWDKPQAGSSKDAEKAKNCITDMTWPAFLLHDQEVPIFDGRCNPRLSNSGFIPKPSKLGTIKSMPKLNPEEVPKESLVTVGYTVSRWPKNPHCGAFEGVSFNVLFVILLAAPPV